MCAVVVFVCFRRLLGDLGAVEVLLWRVRRLSDLVRRNSDTGGTEPLFGDVKRDNIGPLAAVTSNNSEEAAVAFLVCMWVCVFMNTCEFLLNLLNIRLLARLLFYPLESYHVLDCLPL